MSVYMPQVKRHGDEVIYEKTPPYAWRKNYARMAVKDTRRFYNSEDFVYLDTETTDLSPVFGGFVQVGILNKKGDILFSELIMPEAEIKEKAFKAHGLTQKDLEKAGAVPFPEHHERLQEILHGKSVVIYNAKFDSQFMQGQCLRYGLDPFLVDEWWDLMPPCAALLGPYMSQYRDFRFISLSEVGDKLKINIPANLHDAIADCYLTKGIMERIVNDIPHEEIKPLPPKGMSHDPS